MRKVFTIIFVLICIGLSANTHHLTLTTAMNNGNFYYCAGDIVIIHKPLGSGVGSWYPGANPPAQVGDSLILTQSSQMFWEFTSGSTTILFTIHFVSISPTASWTTTDTSKCTESSILLHAQVNPQPDFSYTWNTGSHAQQISVTNPGIYKVTTSGACATTIDSINVINYPVPTPNLGPDVTICDGSTVPLNPGSFAGYLWSTTANTPTINVTTDGQYIVTVTDIHGCKAKDTVVVSFLYAPAINICYVEFDTITLKNRIAWASSPSNVAEINIYNEISTNIYSLIGTVPASQTSFVDMTSNPQNMSYSYKISVTDTCGNKGDSSAYHKTITLLSAYDQPSNTYGFTWSAYEGLSVPNYLIYGLTSSNQVTLIGQVPGNTYFYNYNNPSPLFVKYFVGFYTSPCEAKTDYIVKSNYVNSISASIEEVNNINFLIYPNPAKNEIHIVTDYQRFELQILNVFGQILLETKNSKTIDISNLSAGTYIVHLKAGETTGQQRIIVY